MTGAPAGAERRAVARIPPIGLLRPVRQAEMGE